MDEIDEEYMSRKKVLKPQLKILQKERGGYQVPYVAVRYSDDEEYQELRGQLFDSGDNLIISVAPFAKVIDGKLVSKFSAVIERNRHNPGDPIDYDLGVFDSFDELFCTVTMAQNITSRFANIHPKLLKEQENRFALASYLMQGTNLEFVIKYELSKFGVPTSCFSACYYGVANPSRGNEVFKLADPERMNYLTTLSIESADDVCTLMQCAFANALMVNGRFSKGSALVSINRHQIESRLLRYAPNTGLISVIPSTYWGKIFSFYNGDIIAEPYTQEKELQYLRGIDPGSPLFQIDSGVYNPNDEKQFAAMQKLIAMQNASSSGRQPE